MKGKKKKARKKRMNERKEKKEKKEWMKGNKVIKFNADKKKNKLHEIICKLYRKWNISQYVFASRFCVALT